MPKISYLSGALNNWRLATELPDEVDLEKAVFIFPGNTGHHQADGTTPSLYKIKSGGGLAKVAANWGKSGHPTLSLPTTGMPVLKDGDEIPAKAKGAIKELYKALGAGFHLVLPVRPHTGGGLFDAPLANGSKDAVEPSLWGGIDKTKNPILANYYLQELNKLHRVAKLIDKEPKLNHEEMELEQFGRDNTELVEAYKAGVKAKAQGDKWCKPPAHTSLPHVSVNGLKVATFKDPNHKPYGAFANTTKAFEYPIKQEVEIDGKKQIFNWPSSEHAYHAQKILHLIKRIDKGEQLEHVTDSEKLKQKLIEKLNVIEQSKTKQGQEFLPRKDYDPIVHGLLDGDCGISLPDGLDKKQRKAAFDKLCHADYHAKGNQTGGGIGIKE